MTEAQRKAVDLYKKMRKVQAEYDEACKVAFPLGTEVRYAHGENIRHGIVEDHGYGHRIKIKGQATAFWIDTARVLSELEALT